MVPLRARNCEHYDGPGDIACGCFASDGREAWQDGRGLVDSGHPFPSDAFQQVNSPLAVFVNGQQAEVNAIGWPGPWIPVALTFASRMGPRLEWRGFN